MAIWDYFVGAMGGGFVVKLLEFLAGLWRERTGRQQALEKSVDQQLDYFLKCSDDLYSKLRAMAQKDFKATNPDDRREITALVFLFATFWAQMEVLRDTALYVELSKDQRGRDLKQFLNTLYSGQMRLVTRMTQRAIGELAQECPRYIDITRRYAEETNVRNWMLPLREVVESAEGDKRARQRVLRYGVVIHAMMDTLDPKHYVTKELPPYANKLSRQSKRDLHYRTFRNYLQSVKAPEKYIGE